MRLRGAIKDLNLETSSGTVIPNATSLEYDESSELPFFFEHVDLDEGMKSLLVSGLQIFFSVAQDVYGGIKTWDIAPALMGRYRARCIANGSPRVFIPDLKITAEVRGESVFELGGIESFYRNDEILVLLSWEEIVRSQIGQRVPIVEACGTLTARGLPFVTDSIRQLLSESRDRDKDVTAYKPFEKLPASPTPIECRPVQGRIRSKSCDRMSSPRSIGYEDDVKCGYSRDDYGLIGFRNQLQAMTPVIWANWASYNSFANQALNRPNCSCCRM